MSRNIIRSMQHIIDTAKRIQAWYRYVAYVAWGYILRLITDPERFEIALREAQAVEAAEM
jgi:hypothetical protein